MIDARVVGGGELACLHDVTTISDVLATGSLVWVDVTDPTDTDFLTLADEFDLHPLALEDARKHQQRPKLERYPSHAFVVAYSAALAEVDLFVGPSWLVTVRGANDDGERWEVERARARLARTTQAPATVGFLLYTVLDALVDEYFDAADAFEARVEAFEECVLSDVGAQDAKAVQADLLDLRRSLVEFRRRVIPLREVLAQLLRREVSWIDGDTLFHLQDVYDHVLRAVDQLDAQRELVGNAVEAHLAILSNRMNQVMKLMSSVGAILLGSTLIAGIYGMNFEHMPELGWRFGYPFALGLMALVTAAGFAYFRRRDWL